MNFSSVIINSRQYTSALNKKQELQFEKGKNYLFDLTYLSVFKVLGDRATEFLQGQLSCDLRLVNSNTIQQGAMCNLKGRVLTLLDVLDWQGLNLILPQDLIPATQLSLNKVAMLSRVKLELAENVKIYGFYLSNRNDYLPHGFNFLEAPYAVFSFSDQCCYHLGLELYLILIPSNQAEAFSHPFVLRNQLRGSLAWHYLQLQRKTVEIYPDTRGLFLPHRIDLHRSGYLSFNKGCYKGQEIVARTHYRAKLKHNLQCFIIETGAALHAGKKLFNSAGETEIGEVIDYCPLDDKRYLIAASIVFDAPNEILIEGQQELALFIPFDRYTFHE